MDKGVIYGLLEDYINNANRQQIYMDIINSLSIIDIQLLLKEANYIPNN